MKTERHPTQSFPSFCKSDESESYLIEVHLIAPLGKGKGSALVLASTQLQRAHPRFIDALDEPSTCIGNMPSGHEDHSSLYTFSVGEHGHTFHRHASQRMFTAISGSAGTQLRFSTSQAHLGELNIDEFLRHTYCLDIPPDCLFTVRFAASVWHQFISLDRESKHPALFAISSHADELAGIKDTSLLHEIQLGRATIPMLTEVLPDRLSSQIDQINFAKKAISHNRLEFEQDPILLASDQQNWFYRLFDLLRSFPKSISKRVSLPDVNILRSAACSKLEVCLLPVPSHSLIHSHLSDKEADYLDFFEIHVSCDRLKSLHEPTAAKYLFKVLTAFLDQPPRRVGQLMRIRNVLVRPFGLRTSELGCPVSSLLSQTSKYYFMDQFPVIDQQISSDGRCAQVILGADDKHLQFRAAVMIELEGSDVKFSLANRVHCKNMYGKLYMGMIKRVHQTYVVPEMLSSAARAIMMPELERIELQSHEAPWCFCKSWKRV